jgi:predicted DNA-binding transcriptional regulator AlpA
MELPMPKDILSSEALTIAEFCREFGLGRSTYFALQRAGLGPRTMKIGRSVRISLQAIEDWIGRMEEKQAADFNSKALARQEGDCDDEDDDPGDWGDA